jgi:alkaline phosphatase D
MLAQISQYPDRMYGDTAYAPFLHGVASGDPTPESVLLWTRLTTAQSADSVFWELALDTVFSQIVRQGWVEAQEQNDWTIILDAGGLQANTWYWYRFSTRSGVRSRVGRTRTAPMPTDTSEIRLAVASCSSIYSGYFNAYARIAERNDLNAVVHLGDYLYDFVDENEKVRVPVPYPQSPKTLAEWRARHAYYAFDPDFRAARAAYPWIVLWDNHDLEIATPTQRQESVQAFREWVPIRNRPAASPEQIWRSLRFGAHLDLYIIDIYLFRGPKTEPVETRTLLGTEQRQWLDAELAASKTTWRIIGNQKMVSGWYAKGLPSFVPREGDVFDKNSWDGFIGERASLFNHLVANTPGNNMFISGDAHISLAADLAFDPLDPEKYDMVTGAGAIGTEFLPTSVTRGNFDEQYGSVALANIGAQLSANVNPHHRYFDVVRHGYGQLRITADSIEASFRYSPILELADSDTVGERIVMYTGENKWRKTRERVTERTPSRGELSATGGLLQSVSPNPCRQYLVITVAQGAPHDLVARLIPVATGQPLAAHSFSVPNPAYAHRHEWVLPALPTGLYICELRDRVGRVFGWSRVVIQP